MGMTVDEASRVGGMKEARLIAGKGGQSNVVNHVNVLETVTENEDDWDIRHHLFLTTLSFTGGDTSRQIALVRQLSRGGCAALVFQSGLIDPLQPAVLRMADELSLPLFELPLSVDYAEILTPLICAVQREDGYVAREAGVIQQQLLTEMLNGGGLNTLVSLLARVLRRSVAVLDDRGVLYAASDQWCAADIAANLPAAIAPTRTVVRQSAWMVALGRRTDTPIDGYLIVNVPDGRAPSALEVATMEQAAALLTLELTKQRVADEAYAEPFREWLVHLAAGDVDRANALASAKSLDLSTLCLAVLFEPARPSCDASTPLEAQGREVWRAIYAVEPKPLVFEWDGRLLWLPSIPHGAAAGGARQVIAVRLRQIWERLTEAGRGTWRIACGAPVDSALHLYRSVQDAEAVLALDGAALAGGPVAYDDVALDVLFRQIASQPAARRWVDSMVGALAGHDRAQESELVRTLETFFDAGQSHKLAAHRLGIHPKTLKYRLDKIEQIVGCVPIRDGAQFALHFALKLSRNAG
ncbi:PucR family transcriptional regulator [Burkholderia sp. Bp8998]|uniref:PucR family transcriptional regulator n=1 Tax=Burkholderia sp. Bp8998 TaxID=2184557 RepID=UPI000F590DE3|nr:PucR family transcriptional regulator [Burkholderia sp. Bp8998]RQS19440.1 PucR family transcriptional regulator [Burkholderia sp. Bp8998]